MTFHSILHDKPGQKETAAEPGFFRDLNLDQVIDAVTAPKREYDLKPFFYTLLTDVDTIHYRHEVMKDMADEALMAHINAFARKMATVRSYTALAGKLDFEYHRKGWFLESALVYCDGVAILARGLAEAKLHSHGLQALRRYVVDCSESPEFRAFMAEAHSVKAGLSALQYSLIIRSGKFSVRQFDGEADYSAEIEKVFEKFKQGAVEDYQVKLHQEAGMNHVQAKILDFVVRLHPDEFAALDRFCNDHADFVDEPLRIFDREIQFYVAYLGFIGPLKHNGLKFCFPRVTAGSREVSAIDAFDIALAHARRGKQVVRNDISLQDPERIIVVSGPNQGGKTTFARMFGQLHYLAALGCPVPGREARFPLVDQILTHFEQEEDIHNLRSKLQDDLVRVHQMQANATPNSILILNEIFASTTLDDAVFLSKEIMSTVTELDALCVWVTFIDELSTLNEKTISMVSTVAPENPALRTFKIIRRPADGLAYAHSIAEKHRLTYKQIKERINP